MSSLYQVLISDDTEGVPMKTMKTNALAELKKRLDAHLQSSQEAEKIALKKLEALSEQEPPLHRLRSSVGNGSAIAPRHCC